MNGNLPPRCCGEIMESEDENQIFCVENAKAAKAAGYGPQRREGKARYLWLCGAVMSAQSKKEKDLLLALEVAAAGLAVIANHYPEAKNFALFNFRKAREAIRTAKRRRNEPPFEPDTRIVWEDAS